MILEYFEKNERVYAKVLIDDNIFWRCRQSGYIPIEVDGNQFKNMQDFVKWSDNLMILEEWTRPYLGSYIMSI